MVRNGFGGLQLESHQFAITQAISVYSDGLRLKSLIRRTMFPPRRKCRKLLVWIALAVVAQVMFSLFLHGEFNFAPVRRARTTKTIDRIKSRLRLQSQDAEGNHKFIARSKLEHARGKDDSIDYERNVVINEIKSTDLPRTSGRNLQNIRRNQSIKLSAGIIGPKGVKGKAIFNDQSVRKKINFGHEIRTENRRGSNYTELEDVFISVKTTGDYHEPRVTVLLDTWFQNARRQVSSKTKVVSLKTLLHFLSRALVDVTIYLFIFSIFSCSHLCCQLFAAQSLPISRSHIRVINIHFPISLSRDSTANFQITFERNAWQS